MLALLHLTLLVELGLVGISGAYQYSPKLFKDSFLDTFFGNYFSQVSITTTCVVAAVYKLGFKWYLAFAVVYYLIEEAFLKLGIYKHNWYHTWFTFAGIILLLCLTKKWYYKVLQSPSPYIYYLTLFWGAWTAIGNCIIMWYYLASIQTYNIHFFPEYYRNQMIGSTLDTKVLMLTIFLLYLWKVNWKWKGTGFVCLFVSRYLLYRAGIIHYMAGWFFFVAASQLIGGYFWLAMIDYLLSKGTSTKSFITSFIRKYKLIKP